MAKMTKETLKSFRVEFAEAVKALEARYEMNIALGNIRFDSDSFRTTLSAQNKTLSSVPASSKVSLPTSGQDLSIGSKWSLPGKRSTYTIIGFNPRAPKYSVHVQTERGAQYKMTKAAFAKASRLF